MITINRKSITNLNAVYHMALGLERRFGTGNEPFAYGTRLCEETGELIEALSLASVEVTARQKRHVIKEAKDLLQIITGVLGLYHLMHRFPAELAVFFDEAPRNVTGSDIIEIAVRAGQLADAINHIESQGIKKEKHHTRPEERLLEKAHALTQCIALFINHYDLLDELEVQIQKDYLQLSDMGYIEAT